MNGAILMYHRVAELEPDTFGLCTPPALFRDQLAQLAARFTPMSLEELARAAAARRLPARAVAITLDDGYLDNLHVAAEALAAHRLPATFFINTDRIDEPHEFWWDALEHALLGSHRVPSAFRLDRWYPMVTRADRLAAFRAAHRAALELDVARREALVARAVAWSGIATAPRDSHRAIVGAELRELASRPGCAIGAHTVHHLWLPAHERAVQRQELADNKIELERILNRPINLFSYPFGAHDDVTVESAQALGFAAAVTVAGRAVTDGDDLFRLPRLEVAREPCDALAARLESLLGAAA